MTEEQGLANVLATFPITWSREFATHTTEDGGTIYVDTRTGETYDTMPELHSRDGSNL